MVRAIRGVRCVGGALLALGALLLGAGPGAADSLWKTGSGTPVALVTDRRARQAGDLLTVIVVESSEASQQANTQTEKKHNNKVSPSTGLVKFMPQAGFSDAHSYSGQGSTSRSSNLTARMTVQVTRVQPDGTLEVEGTRTVVINSERQELRLSGRIRPEDVALDNTVLSSLIANAQITYTGKGAVGQTQRPGLIARLLSIIF